MWTALLTFNDPVYSWFLNVSWAWPEVLRIQVVRSYIRPLDVIKLSHLAQMSTGTHRSTDYNMSYTLLAGAHNQEAIILVAICVLFCTDKPTLR